MHPFADSTPCECCGSPSADSSSDTEWTANLLEIAFESAPIGKAIVGLDQRWLRVNKALCRIVGYEAHELLDAPIPGIIDPEQRSQIQEDVASLLSGQASEYERERRYRHKDGRPIWVQVNVTLARDSGGRPIAFIVQVQDVTQRRKGEQDLQDAQAQLTLAMEAARIGCWNWEPRSGEANWSPVLESLYGLERGRFEGTYADFLARVHSDDCDRVHETLLQAVRENGSFTHEFRVVLPDGSIRWLMEKGRVVLNAEGEIAQVVGVDVDVTERRLAEEEIRFQKALLEAQMEGGIDGVLVVAPDARILSYNRKLLEVWDIPEDLPAQGPDAPLLKAATDRTADPAAFLARVQHLYEHPEESGREEIPLADGRVLDRYTAPLRGEDGTDYGRIWFFRDITKQKRASAVLQQQKELLQTVVDNIPVMISFFGPDHTLRMVNRHWERVLGWSCEEATTSDLFRELHPNPADRREVLAFIARAEGVWIDAPVRVRDGRDIETSWAVVRLSDGSSIGIGQDISARKAAERALQESERLARSTVDALTAHIAILDEDGTVLAVNRSWQQFAVENGGDHDGCGVNANYLSICNSAVGPSSEEASAAAAAIRAVIRGERDEAELEYPCHSPAEQRWFRMRVTRFSGDGPRRVVVAHENVTAAKVAQRTELERLALRSAVDAMKHVLGVVGHELRTPLAGLRAMSEVLLSADSASADLTRGYLARINSEVVRMTQTVNDLLESARLNSGAARWNWRVLSVRRAVRDAITPLLPLVATDVVTLEWSVEPDNMVMRGDPEAVRRLVQNLVSNAMKHTDSGRICVHAARTADHDGEWIEIVVRDSGNGIPTHVLERLGEAFALNSGVIGGSHITGAGLGLTICRGIVQAHGGTIGVNSTVGQGTIVTVRLRADLPVPIASSGKGSICSGVSIHANLPAGWE